MQTDSVPVIDLSPFASTNGSSSFPTNDQLRAARDLRTACERVGFFYVTGHGCPSETVAQMNQSMGEFFDQPLQEKLNLEAHKNPLWRGYNSLETGAHSCTPQEEGEARDRKESFTIGAEPTMGTSPMHGPNQWPENVPGFEENARQYWKALSSTVATRLMRALALSLDLDMDFFVDKCHRSPHPQMVLLRYPPAPQATTTTTCSIGDKKPTGCGAHTDCGFLTILTQDQVGLEVRHANGHWVSAPPMEDAFVVNLGDMMAHWTNDRYRSTPHRVSNPSTTRSRHSIPFFWTVDYDTLVEAIPSCVDYRNGAVYPPTTSGEYILSKLGLMYLAGGKENEPAQEQEASGKASAKNNGAEEATVAPAKEIKVCG